MAVVMVDADSNDRRVWERKRLSIVRGFQQAAGAYSSPPVGVACVPMSTSESWLVADHAALRALNCDDSALTRRAPEALWGPDHPKEYMERLFDPRPDRALRVQIAETIAFQTLWDLCPISFRPFNTDLLSPTGSLPA